MKEIISLHVGQAGVQLGNACWELYCLEHDIQSDGYTNSNNNVDQGFRSFFSETQTHKVRPRSLYIDLEPTAINTIRNGPFKELYDTNSFINGKEDAGSNYARGRYSGGKEIIEDTINRIRKLSEECDGLHGFMISHCIGGGTGSGFNSLLLQQLSSEFGKKRKELITLLPSPLLATSVLEPYNCVMAVHDILENSDVTYMMENERIYDLCRRHMETETPSYCDMNQLTAQVVSSLSAGRRMSTDLYGIEEFPEYLVPYPRLNCVLTSYVPFQHNNSLLSNPNVVDLCTSSLEGPNWMAKCEPKSHRYLALSLLFRGDFPTREITNAVQTIRQHSNTVQFVGWSTCYLRVSHSNLAPRAVPGGKQAQVPRAVTAVANTTAIRHLFEKMGHDIDNMYKKRAFCHWFVGEGMELEEIDAAKEDLEFLLQDYKEVSADEYYEHEADDDAEY